MDLYLGFLDLNQQNVSFLHDVAHSPFALVALLIALAGLTSSFRPFLAKRKLSWLVFATSIVIIVAVAFLVN